MTCMAGGRQYVVIAVGGGLNAELLAYALPSLTIGRAGRVGQTGLARGLFFAASPMRFQFSGPVLAGQTRRGTFRVAVSRPPTSCAEHGGQECRLKTKGRR